MPKIIIFTASFGGGHNSVAHALSDYLKSHYPKIEVEVIDFMKQFVASDRIIQALYKQSAKRLPAAYGLFFRLTDKLFDKPIWKKKLIPSVNKVRLFLAEAKPDMVISVYPTPGLVCSLLAKELGFKTATIITDFGAHSQWIQPLTDQYFVPTDDLKKFLISKGIKSKRIEVTGIPLKKEFAMSHKPASVRQRFGLPNKFTVLLMSGEYGIGNIKELCKRLIKLPLQLIVICGNNKQLYRKVTELKDKTKATNILCLGFTDQVHNLMSISDVLIGKAGGITVSEAMTMGLPLIIYRPIPGQESFNVDYLVTEGAALYARHKDDVLKGAEFLYEHPGRLKEMKQKARQIGRPNATKLICRWLSNNITESH
jgi:processive 1,2-diacylglycerol beta-glucosyltransferase